MKIYSNWTLLQLLIDDIKTRQATYNMFLVKG